MLTVTLDQENMEPWKYKAVWLCLVWGSETSPSMDKDPHGKIGFKNVKGKRVSQLDVVEH